MSSITPGPLRLATALDYAKMDAVLAAGGLCDMPAKSAKILAAAGCLEYLEEVRLTREFGPFSPGSKPLPLAPENIVFRSATGGAQ